MFARVSILPLLTDKRELRHQSSSQCWPFYVKIIFSIRKNLLIFEIPFQPDAASHHSGELGVVLKAAARVLCEALFHGLFHNPANACGKAGKSYGFHDCFHKLVVRHGYIKKYFFNQK